MLSLVLIITENLADDIRVERKSIATLEIIANPLVILTPAAGELIWVEWDDAYIVYQLSSTETHFFNETTALIIESLRQGPLSMESMRNWIMDELGGQSSDGLQLTMAVERLEELGLIDASDETAPGL